MKITESNKLYKKAKKIIPGGSQTFSKGVTQFVEGFAPKYLERGKGSYVWDLDGNKFLDYIMACHPLILGYADKDVNRAVSAQLNKGSTFSQMNKLEYDVSKKLIEAIPSAEMVRFGKNGADATSVGVRIARAVTGRDHIAYCGYHGWHDWYIANTDLNSGIPAFNQKLAHSFKYNDLDSLEKLFKKYKDKISIVIMEPLTILEPECYGSSNCSKYCKINCQNNFLSEVKKMTHHYGALLMFDEIITGFRFNYGGAQKLVGVTPDLSAFAKCISNGIPLSAIVGKKDYMQALEKTFFSFTYGGDCVGLAAASVCLDKLKQKKVADYLNNIGRILKDGINKIIENYQMSDFISCIGYPCRTVFSFDGKNTFDNLSMKSWFQQELLKREILWTGYHAIAFTHNKKDINKTLNAFDEIIHDFKKIKDNKIKLENLLLGKKIEPVFRKVADFNSYIQKDKL